MPWKKRYLTETEKQNLTPFVVEGQGSGVQPRERMVAMNLSANPESARRYLQTLGYEVASYGPGYSFAVRRSPNEPWKPVDPRGLDSGDLADLGADLIMGILSGAAATGGAFVGGVPGAVAAGASAGAGLEAARQWFGRKAGIPDNADAGQIALSGALEGAVPAAGKVASKIIRLTGRGGQKALPTVGRAGVQSAARIAGIPGMGDMSREQVLREITKVTRRGAPRPRSFEQIATDFVQAVHRLGDDNIDELVDARRMLEDAQRSGLLVDISDEMEPLMELVRAARLRNAGGKVSAATATARPAIRDSKGRLITIGTPGFSGTRGVGIGDKTKMALGAEARLANEVEAFLTNARETFLGDIDLRAVPVGLVDKLKTRMQQVIRDAGAYKEFAKDSAAYIDSLDAVAKRLRRTEEVLMTSAGYTDFVAKMGEGSKKLNLLDNFRNIIRQTPQQTAVQRAEAYLSGLYGRGSGSAISGLHDLERTFNVQFVEEVRGASVLRRLGPGSEPELVSRMSAMGLPISATLLGGGLGFYKMGVPGAVAGAILGGFTGSPQNVVAATRFGVNVVGPALDRAANAAARFSPSIAAQLKAAIPAQTTAIMYGKSAAKEDRPRRVVLTER